MAILVDYRCNECKAVVEAFVENPVPANRECTVCGGLSRRTWSPVGLISGSSSSKEQDTAAAARKSVTKTKAPLCATNPGVPGLCHMSESAGRSWIARYRGDGRSFDRELERQEKAAKESRPTMDDAISHSHSHSSPKAAI